MKYNLLRLVIDDVKINSFTDGYWATDEEALGLIIARVFDWDGVAIVKALGYALEDANFHTLRDIIDEVASVHMSNYSGAITPEAVVETVVPSFTDDTKEYTVKKFKDGSWECSCPAFKYHEGECKHIKHIKIDLRSPATRRYR